MHDKASVELLPGTEVFARGLRWEVVTSQSLGSETLFRLRGLENAVLGKEFDLLHPFEEIAPVRHELDPTRAAPLTNWLVYHQAFLLEQALGPNALLAVQPGRLRLEPYQLVPVIRAIRGTRVRLLLADSVGLGKTVQAGLVITELVARRLAHRILIVSPAGPLLEQWKMEMSQRFGLRLEVIDRGKLNEVKRASELGSNPFDFISLGIASVDFLKQEQVLNLLERANSYDIVIIDEAHHCMDSGGNQNLEDSLRRKLAEVLARRCDSLLLLTATPHDGNDRSFASLCELLDPSLVDGRGALRATKYRMHVVRRLKKHIVDPNTKQPLFRERVVEPVPVVAHPKEHATFVEMQRALLDLIAPELRSAFRNKRYSDVLAFIALLKRSVSTVEALKSTVSVVAERFQTLLNTTAEAQESRRERIRTLREYQKKLDRFGVLSVEEDEERSLLEAEDLAQQLASLQRETRSGSRKVSKFSDVVEQLDDIVDRARDALKQDPKIDRLVELIQEIRAGEPRANVLVYTEYVDSQRAVAEALDRAKIGPIITMNGSDGEKARNAITERFRTRDDLVLVSTDSAAEGLNLHQRCHHLIHLELPFNPNRLEQRNGRIDRYGQKLDPMVRYLYLRGTFEERILLRLIAKYERQRAALTFVPNTLGVTTASDASQERLLRGIMEEDTKLFKDEATLFDFEESDESEGADEATRELLEEIDRSLKGFEQATKTHVWLGDAGLNAEEKLVAEASEAEVQGKRAESVDLARFVQDAIQLDGGQIVDELPLDHCFTVRVPPVWCHGLDALPGFDPDLRLMRLTTDMELTTDSAGNAVGYLGRAHPLVRRALDRVRNLSFGSGSTHRQDPRSSAVKADVAHPVLLFTYLARVMSRAGRELERVIAVMVQKEGSVETFLSADEWTRFAEPSKAIKTTGIWEKHFESWSKEAAERSKAGAVEHFRAMANTFIDQRCSSLEAEQQSQRDWIAKRAEEITGTPSSPTPQQGLLFETPESSLPTAPPTWLSIKDPTERLAAFATDRNQRPASRSEADGVLRLAKQRMQLLDMLSDLRPPEVLPLGVLMIVPEVGYGA